MRNFPSSVDGKNAMLPVVLIESWIKNLDSISEPLSSISSVFDGPVERANSLSPTTVMDWISVSGISDKNALALPESG